MDHADELIRRTKDSFLDRGFDVRDRYEGEVLEARATSVELPEVDDIELVALRKNQATFRAPITVEFEADIRYGDDNSAQYDRESGPRYWNHIEQTVAGTEYDEELEVDVTFHGTNPNAFRITNLSTFGRPTIYVETSDSERRKRIER